MPGSLSAPSYVEIETSSHCNRTCAWCPNAGGTRLHPQELMPWGLFEKIVNDLADLRFAGWIALHNYNEPLANPRLFDELAYLRAWLPESRPSIFTNGDYVDVPKLRALARVGVAYVRLMAYPAATRAGLAPEAADVQRWITGHGLEDLVPWTFSIARQGRAAVGRLDGATLEVIAPNIDSYNWRGGTVLVLGIASRQEPCYMTTHSASIDHRGRMKMCCNVYPEEPAHAPYVVGSLQDASFREVWESPAMQRFRESHARSNWGLSPICSGCRHALPDSQVTQNLHRERGLPS